MTAAIHRDHAIAGRDQRFIPARFLPVLNPAGGEAVNQHDACARPHAVASDRHAVRRGRKLRHARAFRRASFAKTRLRVYDQAMNRWLFIAAASGAAAVGFGAFAAHGLDGRIGTSARAIFETGARYHMYHALAMGLAALAMRDSNAARPARRSRVLSRRNRAFFGFALSSCPDKTGMARLRHAARRAFVVAGWVALGVAALRL